MDQRQESPNAEATGHQVVDCGGLRFEASFRAPYGATLRVFGDVDDRSTELLRFDDFIEGPHYHVPSAADPIPFDRTLGEPLDWYVSQLRDHLTELLTDAGFGHILSDVDVAVVAGHAEEIRKAMEACVPDGYARLPGTGLQRLPA